MVHVQYVIQCRLFDNVADWLPPVQQTTNSTPRQTSIRYYPSLDSKTLSILDFGTTKQRFEKTIKKCKDMMEEGQSDAALDITVLTSSFRGIGRRIFTIANLLRHNRWEYTPYMTFADQVLSFDAKFAALSHCCWAELHEAITEVKKYYEMKSAATKFHPNDHCLEEELDLAVLDAEDEAGEEAAQKALSDLEETYVATSIGRFEHQFKIGCETLIAELERYKPVRDILELSFGMKDDMKLLTDNITQAKQQAMAVMNRLRNFSTS